MPLFRLKLSQLLFILLFTLSGTAMGADISIQDLRVEYAKHPLGIDIKEPRFSWQMQSGENSYGCKQTAYQLTVTDKNSKEVWNSGKIKSDISLNIKYKGAILQPTTRYNWQVNVWDQQNKKHTAHSWFETGLMNPGINAWNGAEWIGGSDKDMVLYSHYLTVFKINYSVQIKKGSTVAGFIFGANDHRLMDKNKNLYHLANKKDSSYIKFDLDISPLEGDKNAQLNIYRVGYKTGDRVNVPLKTFSIPATIINNDNKYEKHSIRISINLGSTEIHIDGHGKNDFIGKMNLNPLGEGGDFIAFPVVGDIGFYVPKGHVADFSDIEIRNFRSPSNVLFSENLMHQPYKGMFAGISNHLKIENDAYQITGGESGVQIIANPSRNSMPMLRTTFASSANKIAKARLYVTARGVYEMYINGNQIGHDYFDPGLTQYTKTQLYQTFDVTKYIHQGKNAMGAILGEGWWSGGITYMGGFWNFFGDRQSLLAKLVITYTNGKKDIIVTNPQTWSYFNTGPIVYGSFYQGEVYDATKDSTIKGWSTAKYNASKWQKAVEVSLAGHINNDSTNLRFNMPMVNDYSNQKLIGQFGNTVQKVRELTAKSMKEVRPGVYVYDMGQNMVGIPDISLSGMKPGQIIYLRYAEIKYPDLPQYKGNTGMIMMENIRAAMAQDIYIAKGGNERIHPQFTFHGFRFIEITGIDKPLPLTAVKGTVISSIHHLASHYETSNKEVNRLWKNITWSTFGNFLSIPTDCPQRNERLGWSGDISVFSRTATYLANIPEFFKRHILAMQDVQRKDGRFTDVAPLGGGFGGVMWGSAGITVAWESYLQYGDKDMLSEHYQSMKNYIDYLKQRIDPASGILEKNDRKNWGSLGDWLSPVYNKDEKTLLWESYFIYDLEIMNKVANILNKKEDSQAFQKLCIARKAFFNKTYIDPETGKTVFWGKQIDTPTSYILPLAFHILNKENEEKAIKNLVTAISRKNKTDNGTVCPPYSLMTGFIGTAWINPVLSETGNSDVAYKLLQQKSYPSWLYPVTQGATTIWERLNSYTRKNGFGGNNRMNSFNHYSFGAVGAWMYNYSLGIQRDENSPGFKHFILRPQPDPTGKMTYAKGYYDSMYGRIKSSWQLKNMNDSSNKVYQYNFVIPANTSATVYIPASSAKDVSINGKTGVKFVKYSDGEAVYKVVSGKYKFRSAVKLK